MINLLYFARLRERLNTRAEAMEHCPQLDTVNALVATLKARGGVWAELFADDQRVMVAINQEMSGRHSPIKNGDEVAFFPPVTGG